MNVSLRQFYDSLNDKESMFKTRIASDHIGLILRSAVNELDWYYYNLRKQEKLTFEQEEQFYLLQLGVARVIQLALDTRSSFSVPAIMFCRKPNITIQVLEIVAGLGIIEHGRRIVQSLLGGLGSIESSDQNEFFISLPSFIPDNEYYERVLSEHYRVESLKYFSKILQSENIKRNEAEVDKRLSELVYPFENHFIGYGADPLLDEFYFGIAHAEVMLYDGYDTFNYAVTFEGIRYQHFVLALTYFISIYIRHERFAEALVAKDPTVKLENVLTISSDTESFVESARYAINYFGSFLDDFKEITLKDAQRIFEVMSYSRKNLALLSRPSSPLPFIIQNSDHSIIRCLTGARTEPVQFLLDSLRYHFPGDYNRHQQSREKSMQTAIKRILNDGFIGLKYRENIKVKLNGRILTDIDLAITEEETGTIILCQLKHQELYGSDLYARQLRTSRLKDQVEQWFTSLDSWIEAEGNAGIRSALQLPKSFPSLRIFRLVIARHYCYPLKELTQFPQTAYANWLQFFNSVELVKQEFHSRGKLCDLVSMLKRIEASIGIQDYLAEPRTEWVIGDLKFTVEQK